MGYVYGATFQKKPSTGVVRVYEVTAEWRDYMLRNERAREEYDRVLTELERNPRGTKWGAFTEEQRRRHLDQQARRRKERYATDPVYRAHQQARNREIGRRRRARKVELDNRLTTKRGQTANRPAA